jgi:hypothetical protein
MHYQSTEYFFLTFLTIYAIPILILFLHNITLFCFFCTWEGPCGHVRMLVGFKTTYAISTYHH